jgi:hypothetical protein
MQTITNINSSPLAMLACNKVDFSFDMQLKNNAEKLELAPYYLVLNIYTPRGLIVADIQITLHTDSTTGTFTLFQSSMVDIPIGSYKYHVAGIDSGGLAHIFIHGIITIVDTVQHAILTNTNGGTPTTVIVQLSTNTIILQTGMADSNNTPINNNIPKLVIINEPEYLINESNLPINSSIILYNNTPSYTDISITINGIRQINEKDMTEESSHSITCSKASCLIVNRSTNTIIYYTAKPY